MRCWFVALLLVGVTSSAAAGDFDLPTLRGSVPFVPAAPQYPRWEGFYFGGHAGYGSTHMDFSGATKSLIAHALRTTALQNEQQPSEWTTLGSTDTSGTSIGGFFGYNAQFEDAVVGFDIHYNSSKYFSRAPIDPITRTTTAGGNSYRLTVSGDASMRITDFGSARFRGGWVAGNFMPYATLGFAVGRANVARTANVSGVENPPSGYPTVACSTSTTCTEFAFSASESKNGAWLYGWSAGGGLDMMLTQNIFLRGEYEYLAFTKVQGIAARINTARVGGGLKF